MHSGEMSLRFFTCLMMLKVVSAAAEVAAGGTASSLPETARKTLKAASTSDAHGQITVIDSAVPQKGEALKEISDFSRRTSVLRAAVEIRDHVLACLSQAKVSYPRARPVQIFLYPDRPPGNVGAETVEAPDGLVFRMMLSVREDVDGEPFVRAMVKIVLREIGMRPDASLDSIPERVRLPRWLVDGLMHAWIQPNSLASLDELRLLFSKAEMPSLDSFLLREEDVGAPSSALELSIGRCLISMLSNRADTSSGFFDLLHSDPFTAPYVALSRCFPSLGGTEPEIQKAWALQMASSATQRSHITMTGEESEGAIQRLVEIDVISSSTLKRVCYPMESFDEYLRLPGMRSVLQVRQAEFLALGTKVHFLYSEVVALYASLCGDLMQGRLVGLPVRFRQARLERESIAARLSRIRDFMNWYEATPAAGSSAAEFKEFYRLLDEGEKARAPISAALDALESKSRKAEEEADLGRVLDESRGRKKN